MESIEGDLSKEVQDIKIRPGVRGDRWKPEGSKVSLYVQNKIKRLENELYEARKETSIATLKLAGFTSDFIGKFFNPLKSYNGNKYAVMTDINKYIRNKNYETLEEARAYHEIQPQLETEEHFNEIDFQIEREKELTKKLESLMQEYSS